MCIFTKIDLQQNNIVTIIPPPNLNFVEEHHKFVNQSNLGDIHGLLDVVAIASKNKHTMRKIDDNSRIANPTIEVCIHKPREI